MANCTNTNSYILSRTLGGHIVQQAIHFLPVLQLGHFTIHWLLSILQYPICMLNGTLNATCNPVSWLSHYRISTVTYTRTLSETHSYLLQYTLLHVHSNTLAGPITRHQPDRYSTDYTEPCFYVSHPVVVKSKWTASISQAGRQLSISAREDWVQWSLKYLKVCDEVSCAMVIWVYHGPVWSWWSTGEDQGTHCMCISLMLVNDCHPSHRSRRPLLLYQGTTTWN